MTEWKRALEAIASGELGVNLCIKIAQKALETPVPEELEFVLPCELAVGSTRFGKGVKVSAAQGAIHRLYERMRLQESRLGELCYKCKLAIFPGHDVEWKNLAPDAASGGTVVAVHRAVCPAPAFAPSPSPLARSQEKT